MVKICQVIFDDDFEFKTIELSHPSLNSHDLNIQSQYFCQDERSSYNHIVEINSHVESPKCRNNYKFQEEKSIPILDPYIFKVKLICCIFRSLPAQE